MAFKGLKIGPWIFFGSAREIALLKEKEKMLEYQQRARLEADRAVHYKRVDILDFKDNKDYLSYVRQQVAPLEAALRDSIIEAYIQLVDRGYPASDAALWALEQHGHLELQ